MTRQATNKENLEAHSRESSVFEPPSLSISYAADGTLQWDPPVGSSELAIALSYGFPEQIGLKAKMQAAMQAFLKNERREARERNESSYVPAGGTAGGRPQSQTQSAADATFTFPPAEDSGLNAQMHSTGRDMSSSTTQSKSPESSVGFSQISAESSSKTSSPFAATSNSSVPSPEATISHSTSSVAHNDTGSLTANISPAMIRSQVEVFDLGMNKVEQTRKLKPMSAKKREERRRKRGKVCETHRRRKVACPDDCPMREERSGRISSASQPTRIKQDIEAFPDRESGQSNVPSISPFTGLDSSNFGVNMLFSPEQQLSTNFTSDFLSSQDMWNFNDQTTLSLDDLAYSYSGTYENDPWTARDGWTASAGTVADVPDPGAGFDRNFSGQDFMEAAQPSALGSLDTSMDFGGGSCIDWQLVDSTPLDTQQAMFSSSIGGGGKKKKRMSRLDTEPTVTSLPVASHSYGGVLGKHVVTSKQSAQSSLPIDDDEIVNYVEHEEEFSLNMDMGYVEGEAASRSSHAAVDISDDDDDEEEEDDNDEEDIRYATGDHEVLDVKETEIEKNASKPYIAPGDNSRYRQGIARRRGSFNELNRERTSPNEEGAKSPEQAAPLPKIRSTFWRKSSKKTRDYAVPAPPAPAAVSRSIPLGGYSALKPVPPPPSFADSSISGSTGIDHRNYAYAPPAAASAPIMAPPAPGGVSRSRSSKLDSNGPMAEEEVARRAGRGRTKLPSFRRSSTPETSPVAPVKSSISIESVSPIASVKAQHYTPDYVPAPQKRMLKKKESAVKGAAPLSESSPSLRMRFSMAEDDSGVDDDVTRIKKESPRIKREDTGDEQAIDSRASNTNEDGAHKIKRAESQKSIDKLLRDMSLSQAADGPKKE